MKKFPLLTFFISASHLASASPLCDHLAFLIEKMDVHWNNIMNIETTRTPEGGPYKKRELSHCVGWDCETVSLELFKQVYWPENPDANEEGYVSKPDISPVVEMEFLIEATRAYEKLIAADPLGSKECLVVRQF